MRAKMGVRRGLKPLKELGCHALVDAWECPPALLNDLELIREVLVEAVKAGGATLIDLCSHQFSPHGVTATATLAESHIAVHTWPEYGYFAADLFFCGAGDPYQAVETLRTRLRAGELRTRELKRGFEDVPRLLDADAPAGSQGFEIDDE
jgi:S-adenosylmethionine decarboxylase